MVRDAGSSCSAMSTEKERAPVTSMTDAVEHRIQRSKDLAAKRREATKKELDVVAELDRELEALELGAQDFEQSFGKPNTELIETKGIVAEPDRAGSPPSGEQTSRGRWPPCSGSCSPLRGRAPQWRWAGPIDPV
jgi:hypothetical protein